LHADRNKAALPSSSRTQDEIALIVPTATELLGLRLRDADEFFTAGVREVQEGTEATDDLLTRQGFEKVFHALLNAYVARVYVCRAYYFYPMSHKALLEGLRIAGLHREASLYEEVMEIFHMRVYHQGETDLFELAEQYVTQVGIEIAAARDWVAEVS